MSTDLHDLFADAYRDAPPSTVDTDLVVRRGRRVRVRRQAVTGTGALLGVGVVVAGSAAFVGTTHHVAPGLVGAGGATYSDRGGATRRLAPTLCGSLTRPNIKLTGRGRRDTVRKQRI